jgi:acetylornithine deacetylase/succinyl-diaminopimelate desuccinylase-like protein
MPEIQPDKVQDLIQHVKENADALAKKGVDKDALDAHIAKLEAEMKKPEPDHGAVADTLAAIETTVGNAEQNMMSRGVLQLLNQIFGTGVPNP